VSAERLDPRAQSDVRSDDWESRYGASTAERRLEALAEEIGRVIEEGPREEREALRDYAVSLIRNRTEGGEGQHGEAGEWGVEDQLPEAAPQSSSSAATLIGYGALLLPAGGLLALVLPPIGLMLGITAFAMIAAGFGLSIFTRVRGLFT
jgi:hypothetical protein